jgi:hypothetical protein
MALAQTALATEEYAVTPGPIGAVVVTWNLDGCNLTFPAGDETEAASISCVFKPLDAHGACATGADGSCPYVVLRIDGADAVTVINSLGTFRRVMYARAIADKRIPGKGSVTGNAQMPTPRPAKTAVPERDVEPIEAPVP